jgi:uncharacterized protein YjiS (DUF1127 family)
MAVTETTHSHAGGRPFGARFAKLVARGIAAIAARHEARVTRRALSKLTDRQLSDIGLVRSDIELIAR